MFPLFSQFLKEKNSKTNVEISATSFWLITDLWELKNTDCFSRALLNIEKKTYCFP
ncbi:UNVERIFIED_CONTAM: hypothetical protein RMT77_015621 [Armadillidium vulgare]